jgi:hypothetical protein
MSTRPSLTPLADLGRSSGQAPLHRLHAPSIAAAGDDAEVGARLLERVDADRESACHSASARLPPDADACLPGRPYCVFQIERKRPEIGKQ